VPHSSTTRRVITYGRDPVLLDTRKMLLRTLNLDVDIVADHEAFERMLASYANEYELVIICHTVPEDERNQISTRVDLREVPVYQVAPLVMPPAFLEQVSQYLH
jgi:hypothetical protein